MSLSSTPDGLDVAAQLFRWPKHLRRLHIDTGPGYGFETDLCLLFNALQVQGHSLEAIDISVLTDRMGPTIDLSRFTALKTLKMSWWSLDTKELTSVEAFAKGLLAPELVQLTWQFNVNDQSQPRASALSEAATNWIREFGRSVARNNTKLQYIRIKFFPEISEDDTDSGWDSLETIKDELASSGIELDFNRPFGSKEGFQKVIQDMRDSSAEYDRRVAQEKAEEEAAKALQPKGILIDYKEWLARNPELAEPLPEEPIFASGEFHLIEGKDIRDYFQAPAT